MMPVRMMLCALCADLHQTKTAASAGAGPSHEASCLAVYPLRALLHACVHHGWRRVQCPLPVGTCHMQRRAKLCYLHAYTLTYINTCICTRTCTYTFFVSHVSHARASCATTCGTNAHHNTPLLCARWLGSARDKAMAAQCALPRRCPTAAVACVPGTWQAMAATTHALPPHLGPGHDGVRV